MSALANDSAFQLRATQRVTRKLNSLPLNRAPGSCKR